MSTVPGWEVVESGPSDAEHTVLLLPGGWCTALFYDELMAEAGGGRPPADRGDPPRERWHPTP